MPITESWFLWALLSAGFAALTAILAKIGLEGVDSDYATLVRTIVIGVVLAGFVWMTGKWRDPMSLPRRSALFLVLSGLATGASWICYFRALKIGDASQVAPRGQAERGAGRGLRGAHPGRTADSAGRLGIGCVTAGVLLLSLDR